MKRASVVLVPQVSYITWLRLRLLTIKLENVYSWDEVEKAFGQDVRCPRCNHVVWDLAHGHKLNKCWTCMLAFD